MSETDQSSDIRDCGGDVAAYALGALDPDETEAFRAHLETCIVCRDELAALQHVVDLLPASVPQRSASRRLRRRVLDAVQHELKHEPGPQRRRRPLLERLSIPRPALALAATVAVVAIAVGGIELGTSGTPRTRVFAAHVTGSGSAEVTVSDGHATLIVHRFSPPPAGQIYEVWLARPNHAPAPAGALFSVTARGDGHVDVPRGLRGADQLMVTPEPAGGTRVPTHPPVIRAQLS
jgi:anti-sigma-K factor RskA